MPKARKKPTKKPDEVEVNIAHWDDVIYNIQHRVAYCDKETFIAFAEKVYNRHIDPKWLGAACCCWEREGEDEDIIQYWFDSKHPVSTFPSIIAHEVSHAVDFTFKYRHLTTGYKSTEARAYLTGALMKVVGQLLGNLGAKGIELAGEG